MLGINRQDHCILDLPLSSIIRVAIDLGKYRKKLKPSIIGTLKPYYLIYNVFNPIPQISHYRKILEEDGENTESYVREFSKLYSHLFSESAFWMGTRWIGYEDMVV